MTSHVFFRGHLVLGNGRPFDPETMATAVEEEAKGLANLFRLLFKDHGRVLEKDKK